MSKRKQFPNQKPMCHDCAFRKGSPEQEDGTLQTLLDKLEAAVKGERGFTPFYCHQGMPVDCHGAYAPKRHKSGEPKGYALCAGYALHMDKLYGANRVQ